MERRLEGTVALVTGATTGIGQATAARLAAEGYRTAATLLVDAGFIVNAEPQEQGDD